MVLKYYNFFAISAGALIDSELPTFKFLVPLGISFYTFSLVAYNVDVFKGEYKAKFYAWLTNVSTLKISDEPTKADYAMFGTQIVSVLMDSLNSNFLGELTEHMNDTSPESKNDIGTLYIRLLLPKSIDDSIITNIVGLIKTFSLTNDNVKNIEIDTNDLEVSKNENNIDIDDMNVDELMKVLENYNKT